MSAPETAVPRPAGAAPMPLPFRRLIVLFAATAVLSLFIGARVTHQGQWLPAIPAQTGNWTATQMPLADEILAQLGYPQTVGMRYMNPFDEYVDVHVIAAASIDAYHEPQICMAGYGYTATGQKMLPLFGKDKFVRALLLRQDSTGGHVLLYYWVQDQHGDTFTTSSFRAYQDYLSRVGLGLSATVNGNQRCIVRVYTTISPQDPSGRQARRNLTEVARALYDTLQRENGLSNSAETSPGQPGGRP